MTLQNYNFFLSTANGYPQTLFISRKISWKSSGRQGQMALTISSGMWP